MNKKVVVISLGGSLIVPEDIDITFLRKFREILKKHQKEYKFVVVCGGGSIARKYIAALKQAGIKEKFQSFSGIAVTRINARFLTYLFNKDANEGIPHDMKHVRSLLTKNEIVFCGALRYAQNQTSDSTSAQLAHYLKTNFVNLTNVYGLYNKNPQKYKNAKLIPKISWQKFYKMANKTKFQPGQHFVLDQTAARIILKHKIKTYIIGKDLKQLENMLQGKKFRGTIINSQT